MVGIDKSRADKRGLRVLKIDCPIGENERLMRVDKMNDLAEMLDAAGRATCGAATIRIFRGGASTKWAPRAWAATRRPRC
jgi:hypothetical protein